MVTAPVVVPIGGGFSLAPAAAASWQRAVAAGCPPTITSAYRSWTDQARMRAQYEADKAAGRNPTFVARPEASKHVLGIALDLKQPAELWMRAHPDYGWRFTDPSERWHAEHQPGNDQHTREDPDMPQLDQLDLEAIDRVIIGRVAQALDGHAPILTNQADQEMIDRLIIGRVAQALAPIAASIGALTESVAQLTLGAGIDPEAVQRAAQAGAAAALADLTLRSQP